MEINTQQMEALLHLQEQQAQLPRKQQSPGTDFESILARQMGVDAEAAGISPAMPGMANIYPPLLLQDSDASQPVDVDTAVLLEAFDQASGTLDLWDTYKRTLATSTTDTALRDAWGMLQGIDAQVSQMRSNPLRGRSAELDSILNELEVLTATEKFKFNRGDYIG